MAGRRRPPADDRAGRSLGPVNRSGPCRRAARLGLSGQGRARYVGAPMPVLFLIVFVDLVGFGIVIPLLPFYAEHFGAGPERVTLVMATYSLAQFVAAPIWGRLSDRIGRRPVLMISLAGAVASYLLLAVASSLAMVFLARALAGFTAGNIAAAQAMIADRTPPDRRARGMGIIGAAFGLGFILGPAIGGVLAGHDPARIDYVAPALAAAALSALALLGVLFALREDRAAALDGLAPSRRSRLEAARSVLSRGALALLVGLGFLMIAVFAAMETTFALWSSRTFGWGPAQNGYLFAFVGTIGAVLQGLAIGPLTARHGEGRLLTIGCGLLAFGLAGIAIATSIATLVIASMMLAAGFALASPSLTSLISKSAGAHEQGTVLGVYQSAASLARVAGPSAAGVAFAQIGKEAPFAIGAGVMVAVVVLAIRAGRR
ncbi:MAG: MFS transporter [Alphaproteobacteria bacterium]